MSAITIESVGKRYRLGEGVAYGNTVSQRLDAAIRAPVRRLTGSAPRPDDQEQEFWALRDISLKVEPGEVVGLIGANGAGKSTLLKILARITPPTEGRVELQGQVGSLLEVGTGFHPELTGRENIFLNGSILGMRRQEIMARYDEIVEFSGIGKFIETPVKRYSSGMFVRLAFSVAAHFEPEILLIDEVLSVGDAEFQRKCLAKMDAIAHSGGHTIVYVSHSLQSVRRICDRVALIEGGSLVAEGPTDDVIANYMRRVEPVQHGGVSTIHQSASREGTGEALITKVSLLNREGEPIEMVHFGEPFSVALEIEAGQEVSNAVVMVQIATAENQTILTASSLDRGGEEFTIRPGEPTEVRADVDTTLLPAEFVVNVAIVDPSGMTVDYLERVLSFTALNLAADGGTDHYPWDTVHGYVRPNTSWMIGEPASPPSAPVEVTAPASDQGA